MNRNLKIAAAIVASLSGTAAFAQAPTIATINSTPRSNTVYISGSSAIKNALTDTILANFCGGASNATVVAATGNTNFLGIACTPASGQATNSGNYNIWVRYEGGSVSGYLPMVNNKPINFLNGSTVASTAPAVTGTSAANGTTDSFGGPLVKAIPDLGIGDVEPAALTGNNYPKDYCTTVWGAQNQAGLFNLASNQLVDEVYAVFVNENSSVFGTPSTSSPMKLSHETLANILNGTYTNWNQVYDINGNAVASGSLAITIVDREYGSGSRAATDILMVGDGCGSAGNASQQLKNSSVRYFSTGNVLTAANSIAGAVTYATIDNPPASGSENNLYWVAIDGVAPSNLAAAQGTYPFWVEAAYVNNTGNTGGDSLAVNNIAQALQTQTSTAEIADIDAIPNVTSATTASSSSPAQLNTTVHYVASNSGYFNSSNANNKVTIYVNAFSRSGFTCSNPINFATQQ